MKNTNAQQQREAQREAVKTLAINIGVREAARKLGLNENRVLKWSERYKWFKNDPKPQPPTITKDDVITVIKPSDALATILQEDNNETKLSLSKGVRRLAKHIETLPEPILFAGAANVKQVVSSASQIHSWDQQEEGGGTMSGLRVYSKQTVLNVQVKD